MNIDQLTEFFKWMTIVSISLLLFSTLAIIFIRDFYSQMHNKLFGVSKENIDIIAYSYLGILKVLILIFIVTPYIALLLMQ